MKSRLFVSAKDIRIQKRANIGNSPLNVRIVITRKVLISIIDTIAITKLRSLVPANLS